MTLANTMVTTEACVEAFCANMIARGLPIAHRNRDAGSLEGFQEPE